MKSKQVARNRVLTTTLSFLSLMAILVLAGCGRESDNKPAQTKPEPKQPAATASQPVPIAATQPDTSALIVPKLTPAQAWAQSVATCYESGLKDCVAALAGEPPAADALPKLKAIQAKCIETLVPLGRQREAMDKSTRAQADNAFISRLMSQQSAEYFKKYQQLMMGKYSRGKATTDKEKEAAEVLFSMNVITQYAQFELLKQQLPKEAQRLGIQ